MFRLFSFLLLFSLFTSFAEENNAVIPVEKLEKDFYDWHKRHKQVVDQAAGQKHELIFIGDSITHMFGGTPESNKVNGAEVWEKYYKKRNAMNMGFGWDRTQNVLWRLNNGEFKNQTPKVCVILIGTNNLSETKNCRANSAEEVVEGITAVCEKVHELSPSTKIVLLGILPRKGPKFDLIKKINPMLKSLEKKDYVTLLDMTDKFTDEKGQMRNELFKDGVHPNEKGYRIWAETMEPLLEKLLK